jgi:hypothetical protein
VTRFRHFVRRNPMATLAVLLLALAMRLIVPAGYMPVADVHGWTMTICTGHGAVTTAAPGKSDATKPGQPCSFANPVVVGTGDEPPVVPAATVVWTARLLPVPVPAPSASPSRLRPPLRAPPLAFA